MNPQLQSMLQQAIQYTQQGNFSQAKQLFSYILKMQPKNFDALYAMGFIHGVEGNHLEASNYSLRAVKIRPDDLEININCAKSFQEAGKHLISIKYHQKAIFLSPDNHEIWLGYGKSLQGLGRYSEAIAQYDMALSLKPEYAEAWSNKGWAFHELKRYDEALDCYDKALNFKPDFAEGYYNKGVSLNELKCYDEALDCYDKALNFKPDFAEGWINKSQINLLIKNYQAGWENYSWRLRAKDFQLKMAIEGLAIWNGASCKHLLIFSEQGVGDIIFYASMLRVIKNRVESITIAVDARLLPILSRSFPEIVFIDNNAPLDTSLYDAQIPFGSLPAIMNMNPNMDGRSVPYLVDNDPITKTIKNNSCTKKQLKCGVAWKSNNHKLGKDKSILLSELNDIFQVDDYEFINLQYGDTQQEINDLEENCGTKLITVDGIDLFNNIDGLLSIIQSCDFIVTTSNVTAHLAGALGKTTFLLVPYSAGRIWYWHDEVTSSWYPSISLYSQDQKFSWNGAIKDIAARLRKEAFK
ncbi:tetratricopeptide repeat protein [Polynucleobacter sp. AP-Jannik-300A-C4]|uniref:tetratricopeptide repeat protein n=1 Tax=Polynucleobacter sp. AP-Jannik-300A-C4 TaxID=2576928 RepID=UPI001BFEC1F8|nr:tetratricopeptide repeat protein [Polynucleobacter sp. AP-Jannik-300A-C4]QWE22763.1 tetratricopeptide repeat protein [Polynucleobacter sp. AP-Jannik-300A-C4]